MALSVGIEIVLLGLTSPIMGLGGHGVEFAKPNVAYVYGDIAHIEAFIQTFSFGFNSLIV